MSTELPSLRRLGGQTIIYGVSSVLGRAVSFLLLPLFTAVFSTAEYGIQSLVYVYAPVFFVFYVLRFDTAYFRFASDENYRDKAFHSTFTGIGGAALVLSVILFAGAPWFTEAVFNIPEKYAYTIRLLAGILFFDALAEIPFARLRLENKAIRFASIKLTNIVINVGLNCVFLLLIPSLFSNNPNISWLNWYDADIGIGYIFISNFIASALTFVFLFPQWRKVQLTIDRELIQKIWQYAWPLILVALAGIVNELIDRVMLDRLLPYDDETNKARVGIYSAAYKFSILISLFTQAYRYAAEPFFFAHAKNKQSPHVYAKAAEYFVLFACLGFLCIMFFLPLLKLLMRQESFHEGVVVVPILVMANIFLGLYYNLSVWYKLTDKTRYAMYIAVGGAVVTIGLNFVLIPMLGYVGSAWATCVCYGAMTWTSYFIGRRHYVLNHQMGRMMVYMFFAAVVFYGFSYLYQWFGVTSSLQYVISAFIIGSLSYLSYVHMRRHSQLMFK